MTKTKKVIKECIICEEQFEDKTRPKNKQTCTPECARIAKNERERITYRIENPRKPSQREIYYNDHLEYPFWSDAEIGDNQAWKVAVPHSDESLEHIAYARTIGGRRKHTESIDYDGDEKGKRGVRVHFVEHEQKKASEVTSYKMTQEELAAYLAKK